MIEKNIFVYKLFLSLNISDVLCKNCNPPWKGHPSKNWDPIKPIETLWCSMTRAQKWCPKNPGYSPELHYCKLQKNFIFKNNAFFSQNFVLCLCYKNWVVFSMEMQHKFFKKYTSLKFDLGISTTTLYAIFTTFVLNSFKVKVPVHWQGHI